MLFNDRLSDIINDSRLSSTNEDVGTMDEVAVSGIIDNESIDDVYDWFLS
jgi:hypothetical protein